MISSKRSGETAAATLNKSRNLFLLNDGPEYNSQRNQQMNHQIHAFSIVSAAFLTKETIERSRMVDVTILLSPNVKV